MPNNNRNNNDEAAQQLLGSRDILVIGLRLLYTEKRINNVEGDPITSKTNQQQFKDHYGAQPHVISHLWHDLLKTRNTPDGHDGNAKLDVVEFLESLHFLYRYRREVVLAETHTG